MRAIDTLLALLVLSTACDGSKRGTNEASGHSAVPAESKDRPSVGVAALEGSWNGSVWVSDLGTVVGTISLNRAGHGQYVVNVQGMSMSGAVRLISFDGEWLEASAEGITRRLSARLQSDGLHIQVPSLGPILLRRNRIGDAVSPTR